MTIRRHPGRSVNREAPVAPESTHRAEHVDQARRRVLRVFLQTAIGTAVIGGLLLMVAHGTLHSMAVFLLAWSAGWFSASVFLQAQRLLARVRRSRKR